MEKYVSWPPNGRGGTVAIRIRTMLTTASFTFYPFIFEVAFSLVITINFFYEYSSECVECTRIKNFFKLHHSCVVF